jgi:hypothetical protein
VVVVGVAVAAAAALLLVAAVSVDPEYIQDKSAVVVETELANGSMTTEK